MLDLALIETPDVDGGILKCSGNGSFRWRYFAVAGEKIDGAYSCRVVVLALPTLATSPAKSAKLFSFFGY